MHGQLTTDNEQRTTTLAIEALPQGLTQEDMMKLITHPTFRAAVERQVHAKLVALGVTQPGPIVAVHQGNPMPMPQTRPPKAKPTVVKDDAVQAKEVMKLLHISAPMLNLLYKEGRVVRARFGFYTRDSVDALQATYTRQNYPETTRRKRRAFAPVDIPEGYATPDVLAAERGLRPKSLAQYVRLHRLPYKVLTGASPKGCFVVERRAFEAQMVMNPMKVRSARKLAS